VVVRQVRWNGLPHPATLGGVEVRDFLTYLARERHVAASRQNQALAALQLLYRNVLEHPLGEMSGLAPAHRPTLLPNVLSVDLERGELRVRRGKGQRDRVTVRPGAVGDPLRAHFARVRTVMARRVARGGGMVEVLGLSRVARVLALREQHQAHTPCPPDDAAARGGRGGTVCWHVAACRVSHVPAFLCHAPAGVGRRHPHRTGVAGAQRHEDDDAVSVRRVRLDLSAHDQPRRRHSRASSYGYPARARGAITNRCCGQRGAVRGRRSPSWRTPPVWPHVV